MNKYLVLVLAFLITACPSPKPDPRPTPDPTMTSIPMPTPSSVVTPSPGDPNVFYALTMDDVSNPNQIVKALSGLKYKPMLRIVFDEDTNPEDYDGAIGVFRDAGYPILGELLDSYYLKRLSVAQYKARAIAFMNRFQSSVTVWEIGNEMAGDWLGTNVGEKIAVAYDYAKLRNLRTAMTGYYCIYGGTMLGWMQDPKNVPDRMKIGLDYVLVSHYERDCESRVVPASEWQGVFNQLGKMYPNSLIGFGEVGIGTISENDDREYGTTQQKEAYLIRYYNMPIHHPQYILGGFWWWGLQDMVQNGKPLWNAFNSVMK